MAHRPWLLAAPGQRRRALKQLPLLTALVLLVNLLPSWLFVSRYPELVLYHSSGSAWRVGVCVSSLFVLLLTLVLPRLTAGAALLVGAGLANLVAGLIWPGTPDYFYWGDHVFNLADIVLELGRALTIILTVIALTPAFRACWEDLRRPAQPEAEAS